MFRLYPEFRGHLFIFHGQFRSSVRSFCVNPSTSHRHLVPISTTMRGFKPVTSRLIARKERAKERRMHEERLRKIQNRKVGRRRKPGAWVDSGFDNAPPRTVGMRHLAVNAKRERLIEERCEEIERQNRLLLARMTQIMASKSNFHSLPPGPKSLNIGTRRKELMRIVSENEKILSRINGVEAQYNVKQWETDFEKMSAIRESLSNFYPDEYGNDAGAKENGGVENEGPSTNASKQSQGRRAASAARSREKNTRLDRVLLVSREKGKPGRYAAERPKGAATSSGRSKRRGQSASSARRNKGPSSIVFNSTTTMQMKPVPPRNTTGERTGGRAGNTAQAAAKNSVVEAQAPETMSAGLLNRKEDNGTDDTATAAMKRKEEEDTAKKETEKMMKAKREKEKLAKEKLAKEKLAKEKVAKEKVAKEKLAKEKLAKEKVAKEKVAKEKVAKEKLAKKKKEEKEKLKQEHLEKEKAKKLAETQAEEERKKIEASKLAAATAAKKDPVLEEEHRWDEDNAFTKQQFVDFYGGVEEWNVAVKVLPGELDHEEEQYLEGASTTNSSNMNSIPKNWTMSVNMKIDGAPINAQKYSSLASALEAAEDEALMGTRYGGINENNGTFAVMKADQALISSSGTTAYCAPVEVSSNN